MWNKIADINVGNLSKHKLYDYGCNCVIYNFGFIFKEIIVFRILKAMSDKLLKIFAIFAFFQTIFF